MYGQAKSRICNSAVAVVLEPLSGSMPRLLNCQNEDAPEFMNSLELTLDISGCLTTPFQNPDWPKFGIYVFKFANQVLRVGESSSGFVRIRRGLTAPLRHRRTNKKNYIAYSWRELYRSTTLGLDYFPLRDAHFRENRLRRALEAEVTFQFRLAFRAWPPNMSEIHFLEDYRANHQLVQETTEILRQYGQTYNSTV